PATAHARIRVRASSDSASNDASDVDFTIVSPQLTVTAPNTAVAWNAGTTRNITFAHNIGTGQSVNIDVSRDGGSTWGPVTVFTTTAATTGSYSWVVSGPVTTQARIRVTWASSP